MGAHRRDRTSFRRAILRVGRAFLTEIAGVIFLLILVGSGNALGISSGPWSFRYGWSFLRLSWGYSSSLSGGSGTSLRRWRPPCFSIFPTISWSGWRAHLLLLGAALLAHNVALAAGFVLYWALWELSIAGGADALAAYAALMIVPRAEMFWSLLAGILVWAVVSMVVIYRGKLIERWKRMAFRVFLRQLPTETELVIRRQTDHRGDLAGGGHLCGMVPAVRPAPAVLMAQAWR